MRSRSSSLSSTPLRDDRRCRLSQERNDAGYRGDVWTSRSVRQPTPAAGRCTGRDFFRRCGGHALMIHPHPCLDCGEAADLPQVYETGEMFGWLCRR